MLCPQQNTSLKVSSLGIVLICGFVPPTIHFCFGIGDWKEGKVPENFEENLTENYRDYVDAKENVLPGREDNLKAWIYFTSRILSSVNSEVNKYSAFEMKTKMISDCFTASDEAFALVMVKNYVRSWIRKLEIKDSKMRARLDEDSARARGEEPTPPQEDAPHLMPKEWSYARWTGSQDGNKISGWDEEGIEEFNKDARKIKTLRAGTVTGKTLETYLKKYWKGTLKAPKERPKKKMRVEAYTEELFPV